MDSSYRLLNALSTLYQRITHTMPASNNPPAKERELCVLLVEDHRLLAQTLIDYLALENIVVDYAADGLQGLELARENSYDAIILDVMLPSLDGFSLCRALRTELHIDTPVIMLTARDQIDDKLEGFEHGADDYLIKPFEQRELAARLKTMSKRHRAEVVAKKLRLADLELDLNSREAWRDGRSLDLSPTGFSILSLLMREAPKVVSREALQQELWGFEPPDTDALRSHIYKLRKQVDQPFDTALIETVKGVGLRLLSPSS